MLTNMNISSNLNLMKSALKKSGFTLVELMVVTGIVTILAAIVILIINPQKQLQKARDAVRKDDLSQIATALGNYSLEIGSYPLSTTDYQITNAPWGQSWQPYMVKVPQDPLPWQTYAYKSDGKTYQLYAKLENPDLNGCIACGPGGEYNYGITSSTQATLATLPAAPTPTPSPFLLPSPSPTEIPIRRYQGELSASISNPSNPKMTGMSINPFDPLFGEDQTLTVTAQDASSPIISIVAALTTDKELHNYNLSLTSGDASNGSWSATWKANDSHEKVYDLKIVATNMNGQTSTADIGFELSLKNARQSQQ